MSTSHPQFTARIEGSPETIFDLAADMPNYGCHIRYTFEPVERSTWVIRALEEAQSKPRDLVCPQDVAQDHMKDKEEGRCS